MISFHILSKRFFQKRKGLSGARVAPITKKEYRFVVHFFVKTHSLLKHNQAFKIFVLKINRNIFCEGRKCS